MPTSLPQTMLAVQLAAVGQPLAINHVPIAQPGPGEVLVRIAAAPIHPTDLALVRGMRQGRQALPAVPGSEASGTVVRAGAGPLPRLLLGRRVACGAAAASGRGTWAEYAVVRAQHCVPLASHVSFEQGALLLVNPMTTLAVIEIARRGKHRAIVSNAAASTVGKMILRLGQRNCIPVINIVRRPQQVTQLQAMGAKWVLDSSTPDFASQLRGLASQLQATLVLDAVAGDQTQLLLAAAPNGSTVLVYAHLSSASAAIDVRTLFYDDKRVAGFYLPNWIAKRGLLQALLDTRRAQQLATTDLQTAIHKRLPLTAAQEAVELYTNNMAAGKVILVPDPQAVPLG